MASRDQKKNIPFTQVITALLDEQNLFPPTYMHHFSDLEGSELASLRSIWPQVSASRRLALLEDLEILAEADTLVLFDNVARMALTDTDSRVRAVAVRLLWENTDPRLAELFLKMLDDQTPEVREAVVTALGQFIYLGEIEEAPKELQLKIEERLLKVFNSSDEKLIRRRALESLSYSSRPEIAPMLRTAYQSGDPEWLASALFGMGRSADQAWEPDVKRMLRNADVDVQWEAVRAAGELALESTRRILLDLLEEEAQDPDVRASVFWSLSQIGGEEVRETLEGLLEDNDDEEEVAILEDALDNLSFTEDDAIYGLFDFTQAGEANTEIEDIEAYLNSMESLEDEPETPNRAAPGDEDSGISKGASPHHRHHGKSKKDL